MAKPTVTQVTDHLAEAERAHKALSDAVKKATAERDKALADAENMAKKLDAHARNLDAAEERHNAESQRADNLQVQLDRLGLTSDERREMAGRFADAERKKAEKKAAK
jgi:hypothetical protein